MARNRGQHGVQAYAPTFLYLDLKMSVAKGFVGEKENF